MARFDQEIGTLLFDSTDRQGRIRETLALLPEVPQTLLDARKEVRQLAFLEYSYECICVCIPFTRKYTLDAFTKAKSGGIKEMRSFIDGLITTSDPITVVYQAAREKVQRSQLLVQAYRDFPLSMEEVFELEKVRDLRKKINNEWSDLVNSDKWRKKSADDREREEELYKTRLAKVSSTLWNILHLGADRLPLEIRMGVKYSDVDYRSSIERKISEFRISELNKYHSDPTSYVLPSKIS